MEMTPVQDLTVEGSMYFLPPDDKYNQIKPYTLRYSPPDGLPQTNIDLAKYSVKFHDMRRELDLKYEQCGFQMINLQSQMKYDDYSDEEKIEKVHGAEVAECVKKALKASTVLILDWVVRRRHPTWPIATGDSYSFQQPASRAHIDHTYEGGRRIIHDLYGKKADPILQRHWHCVNVWHPLQGPTMDWPLALCDAETVDFDNDTMAGDVVDRDSVFENTQVRYNPEQKWYYLPNQMPSELLVFKNADSEASAGVTAGVPHASFDNPLSLDSEVRRESIEVRVLVIW